MNYERGWADKRNAAGFAAACARLAFRFYIGDKRSVIVAAIEIAERYANGEQIAHACASNAANAANAAYAANAAAYAANAAYGCAAAANAAAYAVAATYADAAYGRAADHAARAGVDDSEIQIAYARWVTRDLTGDRELPEELRQAAGAAIVAGDEGLARELLR